MQKFFEFKKNNKHLLFVISFLILSITSITQFYFLEGSIFNFFYQPFLINFFGLSTIIFLFWLLGLIITIYYLSINYKNKKNIIFIFIFPMILIIQMSSLSAFFNYNNEGIFKFSYGGLLGEYIIKFPTVWDRFNPSQLNYLLGIVRFLLINLILIFIFFPKKTLKKINKLFTLVSNLIGRYKSKKLESESIKRDLEKKYDIAEKQFPKKDLVDSNDNLDNENIESKVSIENSTDSHTFTPNIKQMELWNLPIEDLLQDIRSEKIDPNEINQTKDLIEKTLNEHGIEVSVDQVKSGPSVTMYGLTPGFGNSKRVRVDHILAREKDIALALANQNIRFQSPMPGESLVGIEVPNKKTSVVGLKELISAKNEILNKLALPIAIGTGSDNSPLYCDLTKLPHLLVAGATGSGKSVCINSIITGFLMKMNPDEIRFVMIDPKRVELTPYSGIPHLLTEPIVEPSDAIKALKLMVEEMTFRFKQLEMDNSKNISTYNEKCKSKNRVKMPYIVIIVDELADLMLNSSNEVEKLLVRLAQLGRATGMHLIVATQRPSVDVVTGLIKANFPSRISFSVTSQIDSRTIIDSPGAEKLIGKGDMLFVPIDNPIPKRAQGILISDYEIEKVVSHWRNHNLNNPVKKIDLNSIIDEISDDNIEIDSDDDLILQAQNLSRGQKTLSTSYLQRRLRIGYPRAARLMDELEDQGVVGPGDSGKAREVL
tara:strand:+ start:372 stop:2510 length:2139 start_codon:yes stop_codon:yes gene_type:complete